MQHLDEGTIHAWLDGALSAADAARVERHATECADCAALVAEARGLVAGASRILSALDDVPAAVPVGAGGGWRVAGARDAPAAEQFRRPLPAARRPLWFRPATLAAAASVVLMVGSALVLTKSGGRESLRPRVADRVLTASVPTTEAETPVVGAAEGAASTSVSAFSRDGRGAAGNASAAAPATPQQDAAPRQVQRRAAERTAAPPSSRVRSRAADAPASDSLVRLQQVAPPAAPASAAVAKQEAVSEKMVTTPPPTPAPARSDEQLSVMQRGAAPRAAAARARSERSAAAAAIPEARDAAGVDSSDKSRGDTVAVARRPTSAGLRPPGTAAGTMRPFVASDCYDFAGTRLPTPITLTVKRVWSGVAEHAFEATAPGASGYWSQPKTGDVHIVIDGWVLRARIDALTGELRGTAQRGRTREAFVATRCR